MSESLSISPAPAPIGPARAAALARLLAELDAWCSPRPLADLTADDLRGYVDAKLAAGFRASTIRKWLVMLRAHYHGLCDAGEVTASTYFAVRSVELPPDTTLSGPSPYTPEQIDRLWALLDERWPRLPPDNERRWLGRWRDGRSPYSPPRDCSRRQLRRGTVDAAESSSVRRSGCRGLARGGGGTRRRAGRSCGAEGRVGADQHGQDEQ